MCQSINDRVAAIRKELIAKDIDACILPSSDPHQSEYLPVHWEVRKWISGFTGSAGQVVITQQSAYLWTDSRYWLQADKELRDTCIELKRTGDTGVPFLEDYLLDHLKTGSVVAFNPFTTSVNASRLLAQKLRSKDIKFDTSYQLGIELWEQYDRLAPPLHEIYFHGDDYIDRSISSKLGLIREASEKAGARHHLLSTLDDIAWLFNLRGSDIANNPVFLSYAIISIDEALLYCAGEYVNDQAKSKLDRAGVQLRPYDQLSRDLQKIDGKILIDPDLCSLGLAQLITDGSIVEGSTPSRSIKACKTPIQISHIDRAMEKDGIALAHAFHYLYEHLGEIKEHELAAKIAQCRSQQRGYNGESFPAIVGYEANGAIVHYRPGLDSATIMPKGLLLCDSGGQYLDGTTDITRTLAVGSVSQDQKEMYTRVLKGHIALDQVVFPKGKVGRDLDVFARQHLWSVGKDFGHGTGHGVGYFLNVHEAPQSIGPGTSVKANVAFRPGMLTSNEPGYYEDGAYGIRIENLIVCEEAKHEGYLRHRHLTLFPIDTSIILRNLLTRDEVKWINEYHRLVASRLVPHLEGSIKKWIIDLCKEF